MAKDIKKDIETACKEIASNVKKYELGSYDFEHYVAIFEGELNYIIGLFEDQQGEILKEIKPLIKLPTTREQQKIYDKFITKEYYPHAFGCEKFDDGKCNCGYETAS